MDIVVIIGVIALCVFFASLVGYWTMTSRIIKEQEMDIKRLQRENDRLLKALHGRQNRRMTIDFPNSKAGGVK